MLSTCCKIPNAGPWLSLWDLGETSVTKPQWDLSSPFTSSLYARLKLGKFLFQEMKFFHICPKQGQETMKSPSVTLELIKEGMKLTFQRAEDPKVIILCWYRGKLKECSFHLFSSQVTTPFWWANDIHLVLKVQPLEGICSKSLHTTSWDLSNAKRHRQILRADALS